MKLRHLNILLVNSCIGVLIGSQIHEAYLGNSFAAACVLIALVTFASRLVESCSETEVRP